MDGEVKDGAEKVTVNWSNNDNIDFYGTAPIDMLYNFALNCGIDDGCDLHPIADLIKQADVILEVGTGYGRVLTHLLNQGFSGELWGIERNEQFYQFAKSQFSNRVKIIQTDIRHFKTKKTFDLILWLWTGLCEFSREEQPEAINHIASLLKENGVLVFDLLPDLRNSPNTICSTDQVAIVKTPYATKIQLRSPSLKELADYLNKAGLQLVDVIPYTTKTSRQRYLYIAANEKKVFASP